MKSIIKFFINRSICIYYTRWNPFIIITRKIHKYRSSIYSQKLCKLFNCKKVSFKRYINYSKGEQYFRIGEGSNFGKYVVLTAWDSYEGESFTPHVIIGERCSFGDYLHLTCINKIIIGNDVLTGRWVTISDNCHGNTDYRSLQIAPSKRKLTTKGPIEIGNNVWIGDKVTILAGVKIGEGSVIGANSVVTKDISPYSIVVGNPAKVIKQSIT